MIRRCLLALLRYLRYAPGAAAPDVETSIKDEIEFHLSESTDEYVQQGMTVAAARQAALKQFGDIPRVVRQCRAESSFDQAICHRLHQVVTALLVVAVAALIATRRPDPRVDAAVVGADADSHRRPAATVTGDIAGHVVDEHQQPIAQAHVLAVVKTWPQYGYRQQAYTTTTNAAGEFRIDNVFPIDEEHHIQIAIVADNRLLHSTYIRSAGGELTPVVFRLPATQSFALRIESENGEVVAGAEVFPHRRVDQAGADHCVYFDSADPIIRRSNDRGLVELPYFIAGDRATIYLRLPDRDWQTQEIIVPADGNVMRLKAESGEASTPVSS